MKHLTLLVPEGKINLNSIIGMYTGFNRANEYRKQSGKKEVFEIQLAGLSRKVELHDGLFSIRPHVSLHEIEKTQLIIIPAIGKNFGEILQQNKKLTAWISHQYRHGAAVASICTGGFLLADTGLLDGKSCSTHWNAADHFRQLFPRVNVVPDKVITQEHRIYTNGGAYSFLQLMLFLIERYYDRETAIYCAKVFQIDMDRQSQSPFVIFTGQKQHQDEVVKKAQVFLEKNWPEKISMELLSSKLALSRRSFDRRFIKATGNTPLEYMQRVKMEVAKKMLEGSGKTIREVMFDVGYSDVKAFREVFRKITGLSPLDYRQQYNVIRH
jgi:transcriptional regulator GlxA family with amidase domain